MRVPFFFKRNSSLRDLGQRYGIHEHFQIKSEGEPIKSILEIGASLGFRQIALQQHYRSPAELIGFSNDNFYKPNGAQLFPVNHRYIPFGDTQRVMLVHQVNATTAAASPTENPDEAALALEIYRKLKSDPKTKNLSIGIVTFFNDQASLIRRHFEDHGVKEDGKMLKVSMVEGIQGDEKDVIIYSFVITNADTGKRIYVPRTGEGGDINKIVNAGRVNVAFSRARCQTHTLISMPIAELPEGIWIKRYARYADANGQIQCEDKVDTDKFDSNFEREFYDFARGQLLNWGIANQVRSCGFRIDFVVISPDGARVAIECDGPTHFTDESSTERTVDDVERESILRAAGWRFVRIRYTDWVDTSYNRAKVIEEIQTTAK
jgi:very-short-patch-repair endonuclease